MSIPAFHPRTQRVSGASAEPRSRLQGTLASVPYRPAGSPVPQPAGRLGRAIVDTFTVLAGLAVFGGLAYFFLLLA